MRQRAKTFLVWALAAVGIGVACGAGAMLLSAVVEVAFAANRAAGWLTVGLPVAGAVTVALYRAGRMPFNFGTVDVVARMRARGDVPTALAPLIVAGTALTTLCGGSVGKEAAALQLGGALASRIARAHEALRDAKGVLTASGMAAAFSALLFAPAAATLFVLELSRFSRARLFRWRTLCIPVAAAVAYVLAAPFGIGRLWEGAPAASDIDLGASLFSALSAVLPFPVAPEPVATVPIPVFPDLLFEAAVIGAMAAILGMAFCALLKLAHTATVTFIRSDVARMLAGGMLAGALALAFGSAFGGTGADQIAAALAGDPLGPEVLAGKFLLTLACLGFGFKGGEIMPVLALGACLGCAFAQMMQVPTAFLSAVGLVALFGACTGCPLAAVALGIEAFGPAAIPWFALAVLLACAFTRRFSLYDTHTWLLDVAWASAVEHARADLNLHAHRHNADDRHAHQRDTDHQCDADRQLDTHRPPRDTHYHV